ncbi:IS66 family transposase [Aquisalimonas sp. APHAB1-3]|uniref:IS66 family transposase n=1 Tax=Aquisalimonas sp. APHAB1-3 TaxID=3402080 RepID=UPI003AAD6FC0
MRDATQPQSEPTAPPEHLAAENAELRAQVASLTRQLEWFKRQVFGPTSERRPVDAATVDLFTAEQAPATASPTTEQVSYSRRKPGTKDRGDAVTGAGLRFDAGVPVETIDVTAPELSGTEAHRWEVIDHKTTYRLAQRPGSYVVLAYRRPVLRERSAATVVTPPAPAGVLEGSLADVSVLAGLVVDKFCYHLPLYRQHQRLADAGIQVSRATLTHLTQRTAALLTPINDAQHAHILEGDVLAMDETPIKAGRNKAKGRMAQGWYWPIYGEADEVSFTYASHRGTRHVHEQLQGFAGTLLSDGYSAYARFAEATEGLTHAQCWAHTRRKFLAAEGAEPETVATALEHIRGLYRIEAAIRDRRLEPDKALAFRAEHARPRVDAFFAWVWEQRQREDLLPSNPLAKALAYAHEREGPLRVFLGDAAVPIDTNHLERALRVIPMGRKNWNFCWTELGARHVGTLQSLLTTCRLQGVNPHTYLVDVLQRISRHPARDIIALTPRVWKERFAHDPLTSDVERHAC